MWKDAQCHQSSGKRKLKPQWDVISHLSEWLSSVNQQITSAGEDVDKGEPCALLVEIQIGAATVESSMDILQNIKNLTACDPKIPLLGIYLKKPKTLIWKNISTLMLTEALFTVAVIWKQSKCPSVDEWVKRLWDMYTMEYTTCL